MRAGARGSGANCLPEYSCAACLWFLLPSLESLCPSLEVSTYTALFLVSTAVKPLCCIAQSCAKDIVRICSCTFFCSWAHTDTADMCVATVAWSLDCDLVVDMERNAQKLLLFFCLISRQVHAYAGAHRSSLTCLEVSSNFNCAIQCFSCLYSTSRHSQCSLSIFWISQSQLLFLHMFV